MGEKENYCNCSLGKQRHSGKDGAIECFTPSQQLQKLMFYLKYQTGKQGRTEAGGGRSRGIKITTAVIMLLATHVYNSSENRRSNNSSSSTNGWQQTRTRKPPFPLPTITSDACAHILINKQT